MLSSSSLAADTQPRARRVPSINLYARRDCRSAICTMNALCVEYALCRKAARLCSISGCRIALVTVRGTAALQTAIGRFGITLLSPTFSHFALQYV
eukprot:2633337-Rhodomonas_salina.3